MNITRTFFGDQAGIQYVGLSGVTSSCLKAIARLVNAGEVIETALLITCNSNHAFLLNTQYDGLIAVKGGFTSGYTGEGPHGLASALALLKRHGVLVEEYEVSPNFLKRLDLSSLLRRDIEFIKRTVPVRPSRWHDYLYAANSHFELDGKGLTHCYPLSLPFAIIDDRIIDLALKFSSDEDGAIITAFRRLEDLIRKRTELEGEGAKLFSKAFLSDDAPLRWIVPDDNEAKGRANLFIATYMGFRNARAHREIDVSSDSSFREFLLVNELFRLEGETVIVTELE